MSQSVPPGFSVGTSNGSRNGPSFVYSFSLTLTAGIAQVVDLRAQQYLNVLKDVQGIYIDNSANSAAVTVSTQSGQNITCPGNSQGSMPLYLPAAQPILTFSGAGTVNFTLTNFPVSPQFWNAQGGALPIVGGLVQVQDTIAENNLGSIYSAMQTPYAIAPPSYRIATQFTLAATPTDIFQITGSASKTIVINDLYANLFFAGTGATTPYVINVIKRSTLTSGGASAAPSIVPVNSSFGAPTAVAAQYTANPTLGAAIGTVFIAGQYQLNAADYGLQTSNDILLAPAAAGFSPIVLNGAAESLCINMGGQTFADAVQAIINISWSEN